MVTIPATGERLKFVASFRIYVTPEGELVVPLGNCKVYVEDERAREFLNDLLMLAGAFKAHEVEPANATGLVSQAH